MNSSMNEVNRYMLQEDAHITSLKFADSKHNNKKFSLFGVFDGHGGREVATYTKNHLEEAIAENEHFKEGKFGEALRQGFLEIDR